MAADGAADGAPEAGGDGSGGSETVHATTVAHAGRALVIRGPAGSGKSALALQMIGQGARLVADDRTVLTGEAAGVRASPPGAIAGLIEVRGVGLLRLPFETDVPVAGVVDLALDEAERLPPLRTTALLGRPVALYRRVPGAHFSTALLHCLLGARIDPDAGSPTE
jgi:HPr kinase/phosphorylase